MDLGLVKKTGLLDYTRRNRSWVVLFAAAFSSYAAYKAYHSPSLSRKRTRFLQLIRAFLSMADAISHSAETISLVSKEFKHFLQSESDQLPNSLNQMAKLAKSDEFSQSVVVITKALTIGILSAHQSSSDCDPGFLENVIDKLSTPSGCGFVSSIAGSFARNLVKAYYDCSSKQGSNSSGSELMELICSPKAKSLIADCTQMFVSTAVAVYLEKTLHINPYNQLFSGLTDPKHEKQVKDLVISVSNSAIATLVKSSHSVITSSEDYPDKQLQSKQRRKWEGGGGGGDWVGKVSSTLAVPSNRKLVVDVTGKVTFETVRSVLEFLVEKVRDGLKECVEVVEEVVVEGGFEAVSYVTAKSLDVTDLCLSVFLDVLDSATWILVPA
ncbi:Protein PHLOEM PROTEIN 2-LIKE A10 [Linum grandiflorum]